MSNARITLTRPSIRSALGDDWNQVWAGLAAPAAPVPVWPGAADIGVSALPAAAEPDLSLLGIDRKLARTMEKQSRLMLAAAGDSAQGLAPGERPDTGLYLGLPTVDEPIPTWAALENWHADARRTPLGTHLQRETAPLSALAMLNSSAAAHVAATLRISGSMAVYSAFGDAGMNALIDAACAVAEGECADALVGAVSPKFDPLLPLQLARWDESKSPLIPGEAASCLVVGSAGEPAAAQLLGYARGFERQPASDDRVLNDVISNALAMAARRSDEIGWIVHTAPWRSSQVVGLARVLDMRWAAQVPPRFGVEARFGRIGPAAAVVAVNLAVAALQHRACWSTRAVQAVPLARPNVLVIALAPLGQIAAAVIGSCAA